MKVYQPKNANGESIALKTAESSVVDENGVDLTTKLTELRDSFPILIQEDQPDGNSKKLWIKLSTQVLYFYNGTSWVPIKAVWG